MRSRSTEKKVVGPEGGTFRATERIEKSFQTEGPWIDETIGALRHLSGMDGQVQFWIHQNPENKILHSALVGEMNGLLHGLTVGTPHEIQWGQFGGPVAFTKWIPTDPMIEPIAPRAAIVTDPSDARLKLPANPPDAPTGSQFAMQIARLSREDRETAIVDQIVRGNIPDFLRKLVPVRVETQDSQGSQHVGIYFVMPDYLSVGTDTDFFRVPMTPASATRIADQSSSALITTKISDDIFAIAQAKLTPKPLTIDRDSAATFFQHHQLIEEQRRGHPLDQIVAGIKKDVVVSNRLKEKPHRVAIYGWHNPNGTPIQPLYVGHVDWYVDYSHGVRLMSDRMLVDGREQKVTDVLKDSDLHRLLSDEGPIVVRELRPSEKQ